MSLTADDGDIGPAWSSPEIRRHRPVARAVLTVAQRRAAWAMRRLVQANRAALLYRELGTIRAAAVRLGLREEFVRDVLVEAGVHTPREKRKR